MRVKAELPQAEGRPAAQKMRKIDHAGQQLAAAGGDRRPDDADLEVEDQDIVHQAVEGAARRHRDDGQTRIAVGLDQNLHQVGDDEAGAERRHAAQVGFHILQGVIGRAQQPRQRPGKAQRHRRDEHAEAGDDHQILREQPVGLLAVALAEVNGDQRRGADREQDGDGEQEIDERDRQIDGRHSGLRDAAGHKNAVHQRIETEYRQRQHRRGDKARKIALQALALELHTIIHPFFMLLA